MRGFCSYISRKKASIILIIRDLIDRDMKEWQKKKNKGDK